MARRGLTLACSSGHERRIRSVSKTPAGVGVWPAGEAVGGGLSGTDGRTQAGGLDLGYIPVFPNMVIMSPGDAVELPAMLDFALQFEGPCAIRYPKASAVEIPRNTPPIELGKGEVVRWGIDGCLVCYGPLLARCLKAADKLREEGLDVGVINARFLKPLDCAVILKAIRECGFVVTLE